MATNVLSRNIIAKIFGSDLPVSSSPGGSSNNDQSSKTDSLSSSGHGIPKSSHINEIIEVPQANQDGVKPSKSPRTSPPVDIHMDTNDAKIGDMYV